MSIDDARPDPARYEPRFIPGQIGGYYGDPCDTNHPGPHSPEACIHTTYDHDACCYLPGGCLGGCEQPGGCMDPAQPMTDYGRTPS